MSLDTHRPKNIRKIRDINILCRPQVVNVHVNVGQSRLVDDLGLASKVRHQVCAFHIEVSGFAAAIIYRHGGASNFVNSRSTNAAVDGTGMVLILRVENDGKEGSEA